MNYAEEIKKIIFAKLNSPTFPPSSTIADIEIVLKDVAEGLELIPKQFIEFSYTVSFTHSAIEAHDKRNFDQYIECSVYADKPLSVVVSPYIVLSRESIELINNYKTGN